MIAPVACTEIRAFLFGTVNLYANSMPNGIRRPIKRKAVKPPPPIDPGEAEFDEAFSHLQPRVKARRDQFVREYIKDFNGANAMRRMGSVSQTPWVRASEWLSEPYTQWKLAQMLETLDDKAIVTRNEVLAGLKKEAHHFGLDGSAAARISAWRSLAKILGIEVTKVEGNISLGGGVMLLPASGSPEEWEKAAAKAQAELKESVRK